MNEQKKEMLPLMIMLAAVLVLVPIALGSVSGGLEKAAVGEGGAEHDLHGPTGRGKAVTLTSAQSLSAAATSSAPSRTIFLLALLLVTGAATTDVVAAEMDRRRRHDATGGTDRATLHLQVHERKTS